MAGLNVCEHNGTVMVYEGISCLVCSLENELSELQIENQNLQNEIENLEN